MAVKTSRPWRLASAVTLATLAVFGVLVGSLTLRLRGELQVQVLRREAESIHAVALMQLGAQKVKLSDLGAGDPAQDWFAAVLESARLRGVYSVQLYDPLGKFLSALPATGDANAAGAWWEAATQHGEPAARFIRDGTLELAYGLAPEAGQTPPRTPLLEVAVPLHDAAGKWLGVARYWMDGAAVENEFARLDRGLAWQAGTAFAGGALVVGLVLVWAFARLAQAQRRLEAQSADLARANQELLFTAKTDAVGAISAHLIHGLKNPLLGLDGFVADHADAESAGERGEAWRAAADTTRRLRSLVNEVAAVLRDEEGGAEFDVSAEEVATAAKTKTSNAASTAGVALELKGAGDIDLSARTANLAGLVLANLLTNAIEASPRGATVALEWRDVGGTAEFLVRDAGTGVPEAQRAALFRPVASTKPGGGGIGLAISQQLARHAGGRLELVQTGSNGSVFRLAVPVMKAVGRSSDMLRRTI